MSTMSADPQDIFEQADKDSPDFAVEGPSTAVYLHQMKKEIDADWYGQDHKEQRVGAYRLLDKLGEGGMAIVYRATQLSTNREVALKVVSLKGGTRNDMAQQVFREASALAMIDHPNVISCFGFGEDKGRMYMALEILKGKDSHDLIADNGNLPFANDILFDICKQAISGFQMVYKAGFIHRDIKPANIFVNDTGVVKVADLGLAWKGADISVEGAKAGLGTPSYMSPEQVLGELEIDVRSDIYSMGASMYFYATGRAPFIGDDPMDVMRQVLNNTPADMCSINDDIPEGLSLIVNKAMQKNRELRYATWKEFNQDVDAVSRGQMPQHAEVVNELQQVIDEHGAFSAENNGVAGKIIIAATLLALIAGAVSFVFADPEHDHYDSVVHDDDAASAQHTDMRKIQLSQLGAATLSGSVHKTVHGYQVQSGACTFSQTESLLNTMIQNNVFTVELTLTPEKDNGRELARIMTFSRAYGSRNFTIAQKGTSYEIRVRTSDSQSGLKPRFVIENVVTVGQQQHLLFVRNAKQHILYINGRKVLAVDVFGSLDNWDNKYPLILGNDIKGSSPWSGHIHDITFYSTVFDQEMVDAHIKKIQM